MGGGGRTGRGLTPSCQGLDGPSLQGRLLKDSTEACKEVGIDWAEPTGFGTPSDYTNFRVLEDTPTLHHLIVCAAPRLKLYWVSSTTAASVSSGHRSRF
jgi:hypothetical protein